MDLKSLHDMYFYKLGTCPILRALGRYKVLISKLLLFFRYPTSGSFIRPSKILSPQSLSEAIEQKYIINCENPLDENLMREAQEYLRASIFEIVGMEKLIDKQRRLENLVDISAANTLTNSAGDLSLLKNLVQIDLTSTLIWNWTIVADIVKQLPSLRYLNLAQNVLVPPEENEINELEPYFRHIKNLSLRNCGFNNWDDILYIAQLWPDLEELGLQDNNLSQITSNTKPVFRNLKVLDLHLNKLNDFSEILKLGNIETLENLYLMDNNLTRIHFPEIEVNEYLKIFPSLKVINLRDNPIVDEFSTFNELDKLKNLRILSFTSKDGYEEMFSRAVGMISHLECLNKSIISADQRRGAEYDIWKMFGWDWLKTKLNPVERLKLIKKCRAYPRLVQKYGIPDECIVRPTVKKSGLITINIKEQKTGIIIAKKVPIKMSVQTLQGLILKLFKPDELYLPKISYVDQHMHNINVVMDNSSKTIDYYSIQDGDTVIFE